MKLNIIKLAKADYAQYKWHIYISILMAILVTNSAFILRYPIENSSLLRIDPTRTFSVDELNQMRFDNTTSLISIIFFIIVMGILSSSFKNYFNKKKNIQTVMLPATKKGKFCYIALRNVVLIPLTLMLITYINNTIWAWATGNEYSFMGYIWTVFSINILLFQSAIFVIFIFSSIYFKRRHDIFALLIIFIGFIIHNIIFHLHSQPYINSYITIIVLSLFIIGVLYSVWWKYKNLQIK